MAHLDTAYKIGALKAARDFEATFKGVEPSPIAGEGERATSPIHTAAGHNIPSHEQQELAPGYPDQPEV